MMISKRLHKYCKLGNGLRVSFILTKTFLDIMKSYNPLEIYKQHTHKQELSNLLASQHPNWRIRATVVVVLSFVNDYINYHPY